ncbi:unnamed protein product [Bursaphelenchus xylophilus]|uniref:(pine wood nematode) hypothetical protein n=1 Tax=Bursaphelenchus xylophilus TaxID=6326 RepID=A0A1I7RZ96_BURXY|nr:unnamed protein product [Bursaphelenchus xylophilus]CAG9106704.1 unnamed protein product [Bursaphelenchus xylophilus]
MEISSGKSRSLSQVRPLSGKDLWRKRGSVSTDCASLSSAENDENEHPNLMDVDENEIVIPKERRLSATVSIDLPTGPQKRNFPPPIRRSHSGRMSLPSISNNFGEDEPLVFPKDIAWDWPFCNEGVARGVFTEEKFMICLPFNNGGTGEGYGNTKKFEKISECNFSWTIGLSNGGEFGTGFWRMELEIIRNLNMLALIVSRDISRSEETSKRLKRVRKVYKLPDHYDIRTLTTTNYDFAIVLEATRRPVRRFRRPMSLKRADSFR